MSIPWNQSSEYRPKTASFWGQSGWFALPGGWFTMVREGQTWASPNQDFSPPAYHCRLNEAGVLVFQDLMRSLNPAAPDSRDRNIGRGPPPSVYNIGQAGGPVFDQNVIVDPQPGKDETLLGFLTISQDQTTQHPVFSYRQPFDLSGGPTLLMFRANDPPNDWTKIKGIDNAGNPDSDPTPGTGDPSILYRFEDPIVPNWSTYWRYAYVLGFEINFVNSYNWGVVAIMDPPQISIENLQPPGSGVKITITHVPNIT